MPRHEVNTLLSSLRYRTWLQVACKFDIWKFSRKVGMHHCLGSDTSRNQVSTPSKLPRNVRTHSLWRRILYQFNRYAEATQSWVIEILDRFHGILSMRPFDICTGSDRNFISLPFLELNDRTSTRITCPSQVDLGYCTERRENWKKYGWAYFFCKPRYFKVRARGRHCSARISTRQDSISEAIRAAVRPRRVRSGWRRLREGLNSVNCVLLYYHSTVLSIVFICLLHLRFR